MLHIHNNYATEVFLSFQYDKNSTSYNLQLLFLRAMKASHILEWITGQSGKVISIHLEILIA